MSSRTHFVRCAALAILGGLCLGAQTPSSWDAGLNLVRPLDSLRMITQSGTPGGYTAEVGRNGLIHGGTIPYRLSASLTELPGKEVAGVKQSLQGFQVAADLFAASWIPKVSMVAGLSLNAWRWDYQDATHRSVNTMKGAKMGARFGFAYQASDRITASLLLQVVELGVDPQAIRGYNPSWLQAGATYRF